MGRVRVGILGTGGVVRQFHLPVLAANPRAEIVAIGNLRIPSMQSLASEFGIQRQYTDIERMAQDSEIGAVVIALPNYLHAPVAVSMLRHGKHVLCEKPMAMNANEAQAMADAAEASGKTLMIAHVWRSSPEVRWLRDLVRAGKLGTVTKVKAHAVVAGRGPSPESWFVQPESSGGGALADVGIHSIDTISFVFADRIHPVKVTAQIANRFRDLPVEDTASVRIEYDSGLVAELEAGWFHESASSQHGAIELFGTEGYARTLPPKFSTRVDGEWREIEPSLDSRHPDDNLPVYAAQMDDYLNAILENRKPPCDGQQGLADMIVLDAAYRSALSGTSVCLQAS